MKKLFFVFLAIQTSMLGQIGTGQWRFHVPNRQALDVLKINQSVFAAFENGLLEYDTDSHEKSSWNYVNGLSDQGLTCLGNFNDALFIGYANGNIDKLSNNQVTNIPAIKLAQIQGDKRVNKFVENDGFLYVATGFSIVKLDPSKNEVRDTYYPTIENTAILDIAFKGDTIFALTATKLLKAHKTALALADPSQWSIDTRLDILSENTYKDIEVFNANIYVLFCNSSYGKDRVYELSSSGLNRITEDTVYLEIYSLNTSDGKFSINMDGSVQLLNSDLSVHKNYTAYLLDSPITVNQSFTASGITWLADNTKGLLKINNEKSVEQIHVESPPKNSFYAMDWSSGKLAIAGGGLSGIMFTYNDAGFYLFEDEHWSLFDKDKCASWKGKDIWDIVSVSVNPVNPSQIAAGSYSLVPLSIVNTEKNTAENYLVSDSSTIQNTTLGNGMAFISSLKYDENGNLWMVNGYTDSPLKVYTASGKWVEYDCGSKAKGKFSKKLTIDYFGNKWFVIDGVGLIGYNDNGTIETISDDKIVTLNTGQSTGALPSETVNAIATDFDNNLWIGTDNGFAVLYGADNAFDAGPNEYNAQRIKIEYEGNVEYVLGNTAISDIEVDGANRKWIATVNSGLILLSSDGTTVITQFTTENSPLISNNIFDITIDQASGELYIITDKGLISYRTDATYEDPDYKSVTVFPNPVRPDFDGPITMQGIRYDSDIKITDVAGNLVYKTTSNGGTATWNGKTLTGERAATGVYLIWTAPNEGKGRKVGKVLIIR